MTKKLIVITGASSGIGAAMAKLFSDTGYHLALLARDIDAMKALKLPTAICISTDITNIIQVRNAIAQAENKFGPIDCLINNAGFVKSGKFISVNHPDHETMVKVNLLGIINCIESVLPSMQERKTGTIINISSVADRNARPLLPTYAATKAAVRSLTESLRMENAKLGIRICNVAPAKIKTPMLIKTHLNDEKIINVEDVAKAVLWMYQQPPLVCIRDLVIAPTYYES